MSDLARRMVRVGVLLLVVWIVPAFAVMSGARAQAPAPVPGAASSRISEADTREWLTYLASDALQGREAFSEGYGLAAAYVARHLRQWGLTPLGDDGSYLQSVRQHGYGVTRNSSVTVEVNGQSRTFTHGDHVSFPARSGGRQTLEFDGVEFVGYGRTEPEADQPDGDFVGRDVAGRLVVYLPGGRGDSRDRPGEIVNSYGAAAVMTFEPAPVAPAPATAERDGVSASEPVPGGPGGPGGSGGRGTRGGRRGRGTATGADFTTVERVDRPKAPVISADETFYDVLFSAASVPFATLRAVADKGEPLSSFAVPEVKVTVSVDNTYDVVSTRLTTNVVGMVEGTDPQMADTYVFLGAHLDHVGYSSGTDAKGVVNTPLDQDRIWNGADDDGSGSAGLLGIAKAFAAGPRPRRSVVFIWHAGEEAGLLGSRYMVDFPVVPLERVLAEFNVDMIGRNRDDKDSETNTLYLVGADRISTGLHNLVVETNRVLPRPFTLDFEFNDPADSKNFYTRSDHYSYALRDIPVAFFFTGTHPDYHANTDEVEKIVFSKLVRVADLVYRAAFAVADSERVLDRDRLGPRSGRGFSGLLP